MRRMPLLEEKQTQEGVLRLAPDPAMEPGFELWPPPIPKPRCTLSHGALGADAMVTASGPVCALRCCLGCQETPPAGLGGLGWWSPLP